MTPRLPKLYATTSSVGMTRKKKNHTLVGSSSRLPATQSGSLRRRGDGSSRASTSVSLKPT